MPFLLSYTHVPNVLPEQLVIQRLTLRLEMWSCHSQNFCVVDGRHVCRCLALFELDL